MGGQLIKGYSIQGDSQGAVGLAKSWKLYRGKKQGNNLLASIFLIEKRQLKKSDRDDTIKLAKKQASNLLRVRHPGVLAVVEPLTEDENILAFVTERVEGNISQLIKQAKLGQFIGSELELKLYLYPFLQTVSFIHDTLKHAHLAISLDNIYITSDGKWKLAGFGSNQLLTSEDIHQMQDKLYDYSYSAPELALNKQYNKKTDSFSIGVLIVQLLEFIHKQYKPLQLADQSEYQKRQGEMKRLISSKVISKSTNPKQLQTFLQGLLQWQNGRRTSMGDILISRWLNDSTLTTVKYLDKITNYENKAQLQFLKGVAGVLDDFDSRVMTRIILPKLLDMLKFNHLIASIVYIIIELLKKNKLTVDLFRKQIWPAFKAVTQGKEMTAQAIYLFVFNMEILEKFVGEPDTTTHLLPLYIKCYDCPPKLKRLALVNIEKLSKKLDYQVFKTRIIPKLLHILKDPVIDTRKDALKGLYSIIKSIDVQTISLSVLPALEAARKAGSDPFVNCIINTIYNVLTNTLPTEVISSKILPVLIPYLSDPSINRHQFYQFKNTIISMITRIEKQREKHFDNTAMGIPDITFTEADFKFNDEENKPLPDTKGNYNFLNNYIEVKKQTENFPQQLHNTLTSQHINPVNNNPQFNFNIPVPSVTTNQPIKNDPYSFASSYQFTPPQIDSNAVKNLTLAPSNLANTNPTILPSEKPYDFNFSNAGNYQPLSFNFPEQVKSQQSAYEPPISANIPKLTMQPVPKKIQTIPVKIEASDNNKIQTKGQKKQQKPKFIGGASGPMQLKKLVGPVAPVKPKPQLLKKDIPPPQSGGFNFDYLSSNVPPPKKEQSSYKMNFDGLGDFNLGYNPSQTNNQKPSTFNFDMPKVTSVGMKGISLGNSQSNNPFSELQDHSLKPTFTQNIKIGPGTVKQKSNNDIHSYFQESTETKPKGNSFDLI